MNLYRCAADAGSRRCNRPPITSWHYRKTPSTPPHWQIAVENLINAAEIGGGWLMFARIATMRALNADKEENG